MRFAASKGNMPDLTPPTLSSPRVGSNAGSAASAVSTSNIFGALRAKSPKYDEIGNTAADVLTAENIAAMEAEAAMEVAGINAMGTAARGKLTADYYDKMASAAKSQGMRSMFGSIAGAGLGLLTKGLTGGLL